MLDPRSWILDKGETNLQSSIFNVFPTDTDTFTDTFFLYPEKQLTKSSIDDRIGSDIVSGFYGKLSRLLLGNFNLGAWIRYFGYLLIFSLTPAMVWRRFGWREELAWSIVIIPVSC